MSECGSSAHNKVGTGQEEVSVNQKVFLFDSQTGFNGANLSVKNLANAGSCFAYGFNGLEERSFVVECLSGVCNKNGGNAQGFGQGGFVDKCGAGRVLSGVATGFEGRTNSTAGKGRGIGFLLNQGGTPKCFNGFVAF